MNNKKWDLQEDDDMMVSIQEIANIAIGLVVTIGLFFSLMILSAAFFI